MRLVLRARAVIKYVLRAASTKKYGCRVVSKLSTRNLGVLSIMPNRPVRDHWKFPSKMERHFPIKPGQPIGMAFATVSLPNSLIRVRNWFVTNGTTNFGRNIPTEMSRPPPEVTLNIPVGRNRNGLFHLNSNRNFRNLWHN